MSKLSLIRTLDETKFALNQKDFDHHKSAYEELFKTYGQNMSVDDLVRLAQILDDSADVDAMEGIVKFIQYYGTDVVSTVLARTAVYLAEHAPMYGALLFSSIALAGEKGRNALKASVKTATPDSRVALQNFMRELASNQRVMNQLSTEEGLALEQLTREMLSSST
ncbi:hypothetical protein [Calidithermus terrae]|uniref:hypothetical protein n=1 Tax=Calidithermus terrae TaxID=1408545 RepID=UPI0011C3C473|nr:hypothetical protein [Calidithermus terrae]